MDDQPNVTRRKPFGFRPLHSFTLRTLLIGVTLAGCGFACLGFKVQEARRQQADVAAILKLGGNVYYDHQFGIAGYNPSAVPPGPRWLRALLGDDFFGRVCEIDLTGTPLQDADLRHLERLKGLSTLLLDGTTVTDSEVARLQRALPNCIILPIR